MNQREYTNAPSTPQHNECPPPVRALLWRHRRQRTSPPKPPGGMIVKPTTRIQRAKTYCRRCIPSRPIGPKHSRIALSIAQPALATTWTATPPEQPPVTRCGPETLAAPSWETWAARRAVSSATSGYERRARFVLSLFLPSLRSAGISEFNRNVEQ